MSGNTLLTSCRSTNRTECIGYIAGLLDMYGFMEAAEEGTLKKAGNRPFCIPDSVTIDQLADVVVKFLDAHPTHRHYEAAGLLAGAFMEGFPCPQ
jgi:Ssp1 endopeptidase immunity protein Rap1a